MGRLEGQVAFITGAARGQGRSHAVTLAREGAHIAAVDICGRVDGVQYAMATEEDLAETVRLVEEQDQRCLAIKADARDSAAMRAAAEQTVAELGALDIGVVNHGIAMASSWDTLDDDQWQTMIDTNLSSVWYAARACIPHLIESAAAGRNGSLSLTASAAGLRTFYQLTSYVAAKHGVVGLAKALAVELGAQWVRVNAICPGNVDTPMFHNPYIHDMYNGGPGGTKESAVFPAQASHLLPLPWFPPEVISNAILFLASEEGRYITGTAFSVDAGMTATPPGVPLIAAERIGELTYQLQGGK